ncbi:hypothetical protein [Levilactobacillus spicheri]|uniref:Uncharacterized protein n=1 Tax=Levilactobacillus spicheri TaxID=216463 RepID=A0A0F3RUD7_9LACO|nr:hypothetical protein [Levilactobacillus spicheri]KJW12847.1 hypothetical protein VC81_06235 [Levilactobacillus spicheri]KJW13606.1 hypothetical protein VC81_03875 [Levilactobacillus spicheri]
MIYVSNAKTGEIVHTGKTEAECNRWRLSHYKRDVLNERETPYPLKITDNEHLTEVDFKHIVRTRYVLGPRYVVTVGGVQISYTSKKEIRQTYHISELTIKRLLFTNGYDHGMKIEDVREVCL